MHEMTTYMLWQTFKVGGRLGKLLRCQQFSRDYAGRRWFRARGGGRKVEKKSLPESVDATIMSVTVGETTHDAGQQVSFSWEDALVEEEDDDDEEPVAVASTSRIPPPPPKPVTVEVKAEETFALSEIPSKYLTGRGKKQWKQKTEKQRSDIMKHHSREAKNRVKVEKARSSAQFDPTTNNPAAPTIQRDQMRPTAPDGYAYVQVYASHRGGSVGDLNWELRRLDRPPP
jgi:hypothetical protein